MPGVLPPLTCMSSVMWSALLQPLSGALSLSLMRLGFILTHVAAGCCAADAFSVVPTALAERRVPLYRLGRSLAVVPRAQQQQPLPLPGSARPAQLPATAGVPQPAGPPPPPPPPLLDRAGDLPGACMCACMYARVYACVCMCRDMRRDGWHSTALQPVP